MLMALGAQEAKAADYDIIKSSITAIDVVVSSSTPTQMDTQATTLFSRKFILVQNKGTDDMRCGFAVSEVSQTKGFKVFGGDPFVALMRAYKGDGSRMTIYCQASGSVPITASLIQGF